MSLATYLILAALVTYTIAVWGEQIKGTLKPVFVIMFCVGVICDTSGTLLMAVDMQMGGAALGLLDTLFHSITGLLAIILMLIHAIWAIKVLLKEDQLSAEKFHRFSKYVWFFWLVPFFSPMMFQVIQMMS